MRVDQTRTHNRLNEITGLKNSVATQPDWAKPRYDASGNTTRIPGVDPTKPQRVQYDAWNRPVRVFGYNEGWKRQRTVAYQYDGRGWRTRTLDYGPVDEEHPDGFQNQTDHYYDESWRRVEGKTSVPGELGEEVESCVWDYAANGYPDALLCRVKGEDRAFPLQDAHFNTVAIKESGTGPVVERYSYSAFGVPTFLDASFAPREGSSYDWRLLFSAYRYEPKTGVYYVRNRDYSPLLGRWLTRDPIGENGGINLFGFVGNRPISGLDYLGLLMFNFGAGLGGGGTIMLPAAGLYGPGLSIFYSVYAAVGVDTSRSTDKIQCAICHSGSVTILGGVGAAVNISAGPVITFGPSGDLNDLSGLSVQIGVGVGLPTTPNIVGNTIEATVDVDIKSSQVTITVPRAGIGVTAYAAIRVTGQCTGCTGIFGSSSVRNSKLSDCLHNIVSAIAGAFNKLQQRGASPSGATVVNYKHFANISPDSNLSQ